MKQNKPRRALTRPPFPPPRTYVHKRGRSSHKHSQLAPVAPADPHVPIHEGGVERPRLRPAARQRLLHLRRERVQRAGQAQRRQPRLLRLHRHARERDLHRRPRHGVRVPQRRRHPLREPRQQPDDTSGAAQFHHVVARARGRVQALIHGAQRAAAAARRSGEALAAPLLPRKGARVGQAPLPVERSLQRGIHRNQGRCRR
mmetsp:Transcript_35215/g.86405  ORF Transcript_35215/g.86405 Transcript_35215/m.86405 type:complete len:201 (-) Transcript_35215:314-916(-)